MPMCVCVWTGLNCTAETAFNAAWALASSDTTAVGVCGTGFVPGAPLRACTISGQWANAVTNPCQRTLSLVLRVCVYTMA
jgi:hypothetical protein